MDGDFDVSYALDNEQQFWEELQDILSQSCDTHLRIDAVLRTYLSYTTRFLTEYLSDPLALLQASLALLSSGIFAAHKDYVRTQFVYSLLQDDETSTLRVVSSFLLCDGVRDEATFATMNREGCFARLVALVTTVRAESSELHMQLLKLLYEMSRIQRLSAEQLVLVDDEFVQSLFGIIEKGSDDVDDPYHYPVIRVLLVFNEQYMLASTSLPHGLPPTNRVIKILSLHGSSYMTFGENIILLLNRETETSLQLLILKLLYLLFTTPATHEYFYTNDLRVLVDVILRNLLDLPYELMSLRHTYLRVLYPLLAHTQLRDAPHYKRDEILKVLGILGGTHAHWDPVDETTKRLVDRVSNVHWLRDHDASEPGSHEVAKKLLGMSIADENSESAVSVVDVAGVHARPGVQTRSRKDNEEALLSAAYVPVIGGKEDDGLSLRDNADGSANEQESPVGSESAASPTTAEAKRQQRKPPPVPLHRKKQPPKAPPARRTRLNTIATSSGGGSETRMEDRRSGTP